MNGLAKMFDVGFICMHQSGNITIMNGESNVKNIIVKP